VLIAEMPMSNCSAILEGIQNTLWNRFHISHSTIQFETRGCETTHGCSAPPPVEIASAHDHHHGHDHTHAQ
jgi:cobalt-zinc-cadmium efflux system protein